MLVTQEAAVTAGFFDHDGTLALHGTQLIEGHEQFIGRLDDMSIITGQSAATFFPTLNKIPLLDRHVRMVGLDNGGTVIDRKTKKVIYHAPFDERPLEQTLGAIARCEDFDSITFAPQPDAERVTIYCQHEGAFRYYSAKHADGTADVKMIDGDNWREDAFLKRPAMISLRGERVPEVGRELFAGLSYHLYNRGVQFMPPGSHKGVGMEVIADYRGINLANAVAAGNGDNDRPMLEHPQLGKGRAFFVGTDPVGERMSSRVERVQNQSDLGEHILRLMHVDCLSQEAYA